MSSKSLLITAALSGALAVALGAFGAHGLKAMLSSERIAIFHTGVTYQYYHTFAMFLVAILSTQLKTPALVKAGWFFLAGIVLFSGSLYLLACRDILGISNWSWLGPITPIGGVLFIVGWVWLAIGILKEKKSTN